MSPAAIGNRLSGVSLPVLLMRTKFYHDMYLRHDMIIKSACLWLDFGIQIRIAMCRAMPAWRGRTACSARWALHHLFVAVPKPPIMGIITRKAWMCMTLLEY